MEQACHRCHAALNASDPFCAHCGAPQLLYEAPDESTEPPGSLPAQRLTNLNPNAVAWKEAVLSAVIVAIPAGLLSALLGFEALWGIAGGMAIVSIYRRRTATLLSSRMGWRVGTLVGLFAATIAAAANGIGLLVQRNVLHQGALLDQRFRDIVQMNAKMCISVFGDSNPEMSAALANALHFWLTPDGTAAIVLSNAIGLAISLLVFTAAGGALGARLTARTPQHSAR